MARLCYEAAKVALAAYEGDKSLGDHFIYSPPFLAIRGSDDLLDWWSNFHVEKSHEGIHVGFMDGAHNLLRYLPTLPRDTIFTGHSRGGAIAEILAQLYNLPAITFGAPKTGLKYAKQLAFVAAGDVVPFTPFFYRRKHPILYLSGEGVIVNPSKARVLYGILAHRGFDHPMAHYLGLLNATPTSVLDKAADASYPTWRSVLQKDSSPSDHSSI